LTVRPSNAASWSNGSIRRAGAVILAATMERRPVELTYTTAEYGNIFFGRAAGGF